MPIQQFALIRDQEFQELLRLYEDECRENAELREQVTNSTIKETDLLKRLDDERRQNTASITDLRTEISRLRQENDTLKKTVNDLHGKYYEMAQRATEAAKSAREASETARAASVAIRKMEAEQKTLLEQITARDDVIDTLVLGQLAYTFIIELGKATFGEIDDLPTNWTTLKSVAKSQKKMEDLARACKPLSIQDAQRAISELLEERVSVSHPTSDPRTLSPITQQQLQSLIDSRLGSPARIKRATDVLTAVVAFRQGAENLLAHA